MANQPVSRNELIPTVDKLREMLRTITGAAQLIEELLATAGVGGAQDVEIERLTAAFGNLAVVAIQAAHAVAGREITAENVLSLLPVNTPLAAPAGKSQ